MFDLYSALRNICSALRNICSALRNITQMPVMGKLQQAVRNNNNRQCKTIITGSEKQQLYYPLFFGTI